MRWGRPVGHAPLYRPNAARGALEVQRAIPTTIISFDIGQTLVELDLDFLAQRLAERGVEVLPRDLTAASPAAWAQFDALVDRGIGHPWRQLMAALLTGAGVVEVGPLVEWLWEQQPAVNLFRKPIAPMVELARDLRERGATLVVVSNSEGRLAELLAEIGLADLFTVIVDSGRFGIEKPDRRIFEHAIAGLDVAAPPVHVGDSWSADIAGALGAGWRAIWYGRRAVPVDDARVGVAPDAPAARATCERWGLL
jgi:putative hydrolase of the HAD superfamily